MHYIFALLLCLSLIPTSGQAAPFHVNILLVSPPGEVWTADERERAIGATMDATAWWSRNSPNAPAFALGWTTTITPTTFSYTDFAWQRPYYQWPTDDLTVFVIDNSASHKTMGGAVGWAQVPCKAITALLGSSREGLGFVLAHEYGHAVLDLDHAPLTAFDIMAPSAAEATYRTNVVGYNTRLALGEAFRHVYLGLVTR
jgi:hypothetical protein